MRKGLHAQRGINAPLRQIGFEAKFSGRVVRRHVSNFAKDGSLWSPGPVVSAYTPHDTAVGIRIASIQSPAIVEVDHRFHCFTGMGTPLEDLFSPEHAQIVVDQSLTLELSLGCIPDFIVGFRSFHLLKGIGHRSSVLGMFFQRFS